MECYSTNSAPIDKTLVKKIKFGDNLSTGAEPKDNCYDPRSANDKYRDNDSMNTLKRDLQKCLPSSGFFYSMKLSPNVQKIVKKKKLNVKWLNFITYMKQVRTQTLKLKLLISFPSLLMNFMIFHFVSISLTDEEIKHIEYSTRDQQSSYLL